MSAKSSGKGRAEKIQGRAWVYQSYARLRLKPASVEAGRCLIGTSRLATTPADGSRMARKFSGPIGTSELRTDHFIAWYISWLTAADDAVKVPAETNYSPPWLADGQMQCRARRCQSGTPDRGRRNGPSQASLETLPVPVGTHSVRRS